MAENSDTVRSLFRKKVDCTKHVAVRSVVFSEVTMALAFAFNRYSTTKPANVNIPAPLEVEQMPPSKPTMLEFSTSSLLPTSSSIVADAPRYMKQRRTVSLQAPAAAT